LVVAVKYVQKPAKNAQWRVPLNVLSMNRIYLDNAATTAIDAEVVEVMIPFLTEKFGNPSSIYSYGRETRLAIEQARKSVAKIIGAKPAEVFFTSGGTESSNTAIQAAVYDFGCTRIISSAIEHHATLHTVELLHKLGDAELAFVQLTDEGEVDYEDLEKLLSDNSKKTLVTLMHANNEIGNILDAERVGALCEKYDALFHSDTVQTLAHYPLDVHKLKVHFLSGAGHKFHGPKGVGILYVREGMAIKPLINGGSQERNVRAGTENVYGIVGFAKALELAATRYEEDRLHIENLKAYMWQELQTAVPGVRQNGCANGLYTVLNVGFPLTDKTEMLLYSLDMKGICVSGGSACSSGANNASHVISALKDAQNVVPIRFSFCRHNTKEEIDFTIATIKELIK
jgi:cysteine desulfurase